MPVRALLLLIIGACLAGAGCGGGSGQPPAGDADLFEAPEGGDEDEVETPDGDGDPAEAEKETHRRPVEPVTPGTDEAFDQELAARHAFAQGCDNSILALTPMPGDAQVTVALTATGLCRLYAGDADGAPRGRLEDSVWVAEINGESDFVALTTAWDQLVVATARAIHLSADGAQWESFELPMDDEVAITALGYNPYQGSGVLYVGTSDGMMGFGAAKQWGAEALIPGKYVTACASTSEGIYVGTRTGLLLYNSGVIGNWTTAEGLPADEIAAVSGPIDATGVIAVGGAAGVALLRNRLVLEAPAGFAPPPYLAIRALTADAGDLWAATDHGVQRWDGARWHVYSSRRWLPGETAAAILRDANGLWVATEAGLGRFWTLPLTLAEKAARLEATLAARHLRYGLVAPAVLSRAEDTGRAKVDDTPHDALDTALYAAAQCFRYQATGAAEAKTRAKSALAALFALQEVDGIPGFPAASVWQAADHPDDPDIEDDTQTEDYWHRSMDSLWWWRGQTDYADIAAHLFAYLVAYRDCADGEDKDTIVRLVKEMARHLETHDYAFTDIDGEPTPGGNLAPAYVNGAEGLDRRGLLSLEALALFALAQKLTGETGYAETGRELGLTQGYLANLARQKDISPARFLDQFDDLIAFMLYYVYAGSAPGAPYEDDLDSSLAAAWEYERGEGAALCHAVGGALLGGDFGLAEVLEHLRSHPLDLVEYSQDLRTRLDVTPYVPPLAEVAAPADWYVQADGRCLPADERPAIGAGGNPYRIDSAAGGLREEDGAAWLLAYWMARRHGLIVAAP